MAQLRPSVLDDTVLGPHALEAKASVRWYSSRLEYHERLDEFLSRAKERVDIVAVSLQLASRQGDLKGALRKLLGNGCRVRVSLLHASGPAVKLLATRLGSSERALAARLRLALREYEALRDSLEDPLRSRLLIGSHRVLPIGSAYLVDAMPGAGVVHVETRIFRERGKSVLAYRAVAPSRLYEHSRRAWLRFMKYSTTWRE